MNYNRFLRNIVLLIALQKLSINHRSHPYFAATDDICGALAFNVFRWLILEIEQQDDIHDSNGHKADLSYCPCYGRTLIIGRSRILIRQIDDLILRWTCKKFIYAWSISRDPIISPKWVIIFAWPSRNQNDMSTVTDSWGWKWQDITKRLLRCGFISIALYDSLLLNHFVVKRAASNINLSRLKLRFQAPSDNHQYLS